MLRAALGALLLCAAPGSAAAPGTARGNEPPPPPPPPVPGMVFSGTPSGVPAATDCAIRQLAWEYGRKLQPARGGFQTLYDALQLGACNVTRPPAAAELDEIFAPLAEPIPRVSGQRVLFVDTAAHADDGAAGTYATLAGAVAASRGLPKPLTIALRAGTHHLPRTVDLTAADSGLTIRNAPGERAEVSGGRNLTTKWRPSSRCKGCWEASLKGQVTNVPGLRRDGVREIRARFPNYDPERDAVIGGEHLIHDGHVGWVNATTTWVAQGSGGMNGVPGPWPPTAQATTHVISAEDWPGVEWPMNITTNGAGRPDMWTGEGGWGQFWVGVGGTCIDRSPPAGYWCSEPAAPRGISTPNHPSGFSPTAADLPNMPYTDPAGAVVHAWRPGHWYTNIFEVGRSQPADASAAGSSLMFSRGGTQGGEGVTGGEEWYIENVIEELDIGREWWFDNTTQMLYYKPNATAGTAPTGAFVATDLRVLFNITGSQAAPAHHIAIKGLTLRDTSYAYFEPHGLPSGGDWGLQKQGAVTLVGTENVEVSSSLFTRLDGNAVFIGGYNRNLTIDANEFVYIGDSAIAAWGDTSTRLNANGSVTLPYPIGPDGRGAKNAFVSHIYAKHDHFAKTGLRQNIGKLDKKEGRFFLQAGTSRGGHASRTISLTRSDCGRSNRLSISRRLLRRHWSRGTCARQKPHPSF
jgi:hypothetical protein